MINLSKLKSVPEDDYDFLEILENGVDLDDEESVEAACLAAYLFFVLKDTDQLMGVLNVICCIPYDGDYDFWTWVEYCIALRTYFQKENVGFEAVVKEAISDGTDTQKEAKVKVHNRFLEGYTLELLNQQIDRSLQDDDSEEEFSDRVEFLMDAVKLHALGGGAIGLNELEKAIDCQVSEIRKKFF